jgi:PAS domain S-box-containing protein
MVTILDITDLQQATSHLADRQRRHKALFNNVYQLIILTTAAGTILEANETVLAVSGLTHDEVIGKCVLAFDMSRWSPPDQDLNKHLRQRFVQALKGEPLQFECHLINSDGQPLYLDVSLKPLHDSKGIVTHVLIEGHNITERKLAEQALQAALQRERELNALKSRFMTLTSQEFRNPLTIIASSAYLLSNHHDRLSDKRREEHFANINTNVHVIASMLDNVATLAQLQSQQETDRAEMIDVGSLFEQVTKKYQQQHSSHTFEYHCNVPVLRVPADAKMLHQIVTQLLRNATQYTPPGTRVTVNIATDDTHMSLIIADDGPGIPPDEQDKIFDSFYRGRNGNNIAGKGLGLAIVKDAVRLHDGSIQLDSLPNAGTAFTIKLPLRNANGSR